MTRRSLLAFSACGALLRAQAPLPVRPKATGTLRLKSRSRRRGIGEESDLVWKVSETAVIICDMWDDHYCTSAARRVTEIVPRMNGVVGAARKLGVHIIHAPSGTMDVYKDFPQRRRMIEARAATPPVPIARWCYLDLKDEAPLPIDDVTEPCDDEVVGDKVRRYNRQHAGLEIGEYDGISDSGQEIYNYFEQEGIRNVVMMGVHTNMCVLGRPFGIRQLTRLRKNVVLARDLTDAMYDPRQAPWVSHWKGTELVVEHVEKFWCPTIMGEDITRLDRSAA